MKKKIYRSLDDRLVAGVLGGLSEYWNFDSTKIRIAFAILFVMSMGSVTVLYLLLWFVIPLSQKANGFVEEDDKKSDDSEENI